MFFLDFFSQQCRPTYIKQPRFGFRQSFCCLKKQKDPIVSVFRYPRTNNSIK